MATTTLQIPMPTALRDRATRVATKQGFSSLQEAIRIFLSQFVSGQVEVRYTAPPVMLSSKNAARYDKMIEDVETGKVKTKSFTDVDKLMAYLNR